MSPHAMASAPLVVKDAATVVMLRDAEAGMEVFLLKRHTLSDAFGGAFVFPGGKVDAADHDALAPGILDRTPDVLRASLAEPDLSNGQSVGLFVAAIRESIEESGVLFALNATRDEARGVLQSVKHGKPFIQAIQQNNLQLDTRSLVPWKRWITPKLPMVGAKRFDTRFFLSKMPDSQEATHDTHETTESLWISPQAALQSYVRGDIDMAPPQILSLVELSPFETVAQALQAAHDNSPPCIEPESFLDGDDRYICFPGDPRHSQPLPACCGPLRLVLRNRRFEPPQGTGAFFTR